MTKSKILKELKKIRQYIIDTYGIEYHRVYTEKRKYGYRSKIYSTNCDYSTFMKIKEIQFIHPNIYVSYQVCTNKYSKNINFDIILKYEKIN